MPTVRQSDVPPETWAKIQALLGASPAKAAIPRAKKQTMVEAAFVPPGLWTVPLHLAPVSNGGSYKKGMIGRAGRDRSAVARAFAPTLRNVAYFADAALAGKLIRCKITRIGGGLMDEGDGLNSCCKWVRDSVAAYLGVGDGPKGPIRWEYGQEPRGDVVGMRIELGVLDIGQGVA